MNGFSELFHWFQARPQWIWWMLLGSIVFFILSLIAAAFFVTRMPVDYFEEREERRFVWHPVGMLLFAIVRNCIGVMLLLAGMAMLVLPGQGLLTIFMGILFIDFPGKSKIKKWLLRQERFRHSVNWLRKRADRPLLRFPENT